MRIIASTFLTVTLSLTAMAQLGKDLGDVSQVRGSNASLSQITAGLREALTISTTNAIGLAGQENGFWSNQTIKIVLPDKMQSFERGLRMAGQGLKIDEFELSMNRAAEISAQSALPIFASNVASLTFADPKSVLNGNASATTDYFRAAASPELLKALRPIVQEAMTKSNVLEHYEYLANQTRGITLGKPFQFDITTYLVSRTMEGLLLTSAAEESRIRANPEAQNSPLIKEVFSKR